MSGPVRALVRNFCRDVSKAKVFSRRILQGKSTKGSSKDFAKMTATKNTRRGAQIKKGERWYLGGSHVHVLLPDFFRHPPPPPRPIGLKQAEITHIFFCKKIPLVEFSPKHEPLVKTSSIEVPPVVPPLYPPVPSAHATRRSTVAHSPWLRCRTEGATRLSADSKQAKRPTETCALAPRSRGLNRPWYVAPIASEHLNFRRIMSYSVMAELPRHGSTFAFDLPSCTVAAWRVQTLPLFAIHRSQPLRPGRAQRRRGGSEVCPTTTVQLASALKKAKPSAAAKPSGAEKGAPHPRVYDEA
jgi:hypothetical protein